MLNRKNAKECAIFPAQIMSRSRKKNTASFSDLVSSCIGTEECAHSAAIIQAAWYFLYRFGAVHICYFFPN
jgi:hypothetical protein